MATTSRRRSSHGLTSSGSSTQLARKGSSSRLGGPRGRFDPSLMMSSNAVGGDASRDKSPHADPDGPHDAEHHDKASRRNKSTDRLQRSRDSSTHLSGKRSKSFTHLAMTADESNRRRKSTKGKERANVPRLPRTAGPALAQITPRATTALRCLPPAVQRTRASCWASRSASLRRSNLQPPPPLCPSPRKRRSCKRLIPQEQVQRRSNPKPKAQST